MTTQRRLTGPELLEEVTWLLDGGVHPLLAAQTLTKTAQAIEKTARVYGNQRIARLYYSYAQQERTRRERRRQETAA